MNLDILLKNVEVINIKGNKDVDVNHITLDSRKVNEDSIYIALPGTKTDGQNFIPQVIDKNVKAILCSEEWLNSQEKLNDNIAYISVNDRRKAFAQISSNFYNNPTDKLFMIGVTGTNGKTTTTHLIEDILKEKGTETGILGTLYAKYADVKEVAKFTTPMPDELHKTFNDMVDKNVEAVVMEVSSHALEQDRVGSCKYSIAVFTNITQDHLDYHPTFEEYKKAKAILFKELLKESGFAIINRDDPSFEYFRDNSKGKIVTYGLNNNADIYVTDIVLKMDGTSFIVHTPEENLKFNTNLVGKFNIYNVLSALAAGYAMKIPMDICKKAIEKNRGIPGRIEIVTPKGHPYTVVVDYAHTPDSLENVLKSAREFTNNNLISVFGCGGDRDKTKRPLMGNIGYTLADIAVVTSDNPRTEDPDLIIKDIIAGIKNPDENKLYIDVDRRKAIQKSIELAKEGDTVVIAGKGHEDYQIFKDKTIHFDDRETAREFIK